MLTIPAMTKSFDPELMYVECGKCGQPIVWGPGQTTKIIEAAEIEDEKIDEQCVIIADGCPLCMPGEHSFNTQIVRLGEDSPELEGITASVSN